MKIKLFILFSLLSVCALGQHCPFDFTAIIVVSVHEKDSAANIPNLRISLIDSAGNNVTDIFYRNGKAVVDTLRFWQNPNETTFKGYIDNENPADPVKIRFPFAKDNYVFVCSRKFEASKYQIKIEKVDGKQNGEYYPIIFPVYLYEQDKYSLCGNYDNEEYSPEYYGERIYKPIEIIMQRKTK